MREIDNEKLYADIRRENTEQILADGQRWMITYGGIPDRRVDTQFLVEVVGYLVPMIEARGPQTMPMGITNLITGQRYDWEEVQELVKTLEVRDNTPCK